MNTRPINPPLGIVQAVTRAIQAAELCGMPHLVDRWHYDAGLELTVEQHRAVRDFTHDAKDFQIMSICGDRELMPCLAQLMREGFAQ